MNEEVARAAGRYRTAIEETLGGRTGDDEGSGFRIAFGRCETPIEQAYCLELFQVPGVRAIDGDFDGSVLGWVPTINRLILVFAQQPILQYRADFLLVGMSTLRAEPIFIIVECDGGDYHSTREQIRRDEYRQRALQNTGFKIIRFTGSEIHRGPQMVITSTLAQFRQHGWNPAHCPNWVNDPEFRRVLAQLREVDNSFRERSNQ